MRAGPLVGFILLVVGLVAGGVLVVRLIAQRAKELDTPIVVKQDSAPQEAAVDGRGDANQRVTPGPTSPATPTRPATGPATASAGGPGVLALAAVWVGIVIVLALTYFLPTVIAVCRGHTNTAGIGVLNLTLGWTGWFWVLALVWSVWNHPPTDPRDQRLHQGVRPRSPGIIPVVLVAVGLMVAATLGVGGLLRGPFAGHGPFNSRPRDPVELHARVYGQTADEVVRVLGKPSHISQNLLVDIAEYHYPDLYEGRDVVIVFEGGVVSKVLVSPHEKK
jgi:Superinfection immunity protein